MLILWGALDWCSSCLFISWFIVRAPKEPLFICLNWAASQKCKMISGAQTCKTTFIPWSYKPEWDKYWKGQWLLALRNPLKSICSLHTTTQGTILTQITSVIRALDSRSDPLCLLFASYCLESSSKLLVSVKCKILPKPSHADRW